MCSLGYRLNREDAEVKYIAVHLANHGFKDLTWTKFGSLKEKAWQLVIDTLPMKERPADMLDPKKLGTGHMERLKDLRKQAQDDIRRSTRNSASSLPGTGRANERVARVERLAWLLGQLNQVEPDMLHRKVAADDDDESGAEGAKEGVEGAMEDLATEARMEDFATEASAAVKHELRCARALLLEYCSQGGEYSGMSNIDEAMGSLSKGSTWPPRERAMRALSQVSKAVMCCPKGWPLTHGKWKDGDNTSAIHLNQAKKDCQDLLAWKVQISALGPCGMLERRNCFIQMLAETCSNAHLYLGAEEQLLLTARVLKAHWHVIAPIFPHAFLSNTGRTAARRGLPRDRSPRCSPFSQRLAATFPPTLEYTNELQPEMEPLAGEGEAEVLDARPFLDKPPGLDADTVLYQPGPGLGPPTGPSGYADGLTSGWICRWSHLTIGICSRSDERALPE
jgi:hypothetical protein